jgi:hypothetical protein
LSLACLTYNGPARHEEAVRLLAAHPQTAVASTWTLAASGDAAGVERAVAAQPALARAQGGPFSWEPLLYLTYSRVPQADAVGTARVLLRAGADPNAGYLPEGLAPPFTALAGALGGGELGQPAHPRDLLLARVLLEAGADANDGQALYNRGLLGDDIGYLELLLEFGLGRGSGGGPAHQGRGVRADTGRAAGVPAGLRRQRRPALDGTAQGRPGRRPGDGQNTGELGADRSKRDFDYHATPLEWARYAGHAGVAEFLKQ